MDDNLGDQYLVTECCGQAILYQHFGDGIYQEWEFCADCLDCYESVTEKEYKEKNNGEIA